jgi:transcriptional regulator with XRE-family HTH domain
MAVDITDDAGDEGGSQTFSTEVGLRLRAVRRQRGLSLDDVERTSGGRWSASAVGAYERGFRNLTLPRLQELAAFYGVPMAVLLGEVPAVDEARVPGRIVLDLVALEELEEARPVARYARSIITERGDWNGRVLSIRKDDVRALCSMLRVQEPELMQRLDEWGALAESGADRSAV